MKHAKITDRNEPTPRKATPKATPRTSSRPAPRQPRKASDGDGGSLAFYLHLIVCLFAFVGGIAISSLSIVTAAVHDLENAIATGSSKFLQMKSKNRADDANPFGYGRYSTIGALITAAVLVACSVIVIAVAVARLVCPAAPDSLGMVLLALTGLMVSGYNSYTTTSNSPINKDATNWNALESVLCWLIVLVGSIIVAATGLYVIDSIISLALVILILFRAEKNIKTAFSVLLDKTPESVNARNVKRSLEKIPEVGKVKRLNIWRSDENTIQAIVCVSIATRGRSAGDVKTEIRERLHDFGIDEMVIEHDSMSASEEFEQTLR